MTSSMLRSAKRTLVLAMTVILFMTSIAVAEKQYSTLEFGSRGSDVLQLQKALLALGYEPNGTDGKFGRGTEAAVIQYQTRAGLTADGKAGTMTLSKLYLEFDNLNSNSSDSSGSTITTTNPNTLKYGDKGSRVKELQSALVKLGYNTNGVDGSFGAGTQLAVIAFQKAQGLTADGLAGSKTTELLNRLAEQAGSGSSSGESGGSSSGSNSGVYVRTLRKGYTGDDVRSVQSMLQELGFYSGSLDGVYGTGSVAAVKSFQQKNGLTADGLAGLQTFNKLFSSSANGSGGSSDNSGSTSSGNGGNASSGTYITLRLGDKGSEVKSMQKALKDLSYDVSADGTFGALTQVAVIAFQKRNGLTTDGVAGAKTQNLLYSGNAKTADTSAGSDNSNNGNTNNGDGTIDSNAGSSSGPNISDVKLLHWFNDIKPSVRSGQSFTVFDPASNLQWTLKFYSLGRHADSEPATLTDTQIMYKAFGNKNTWTAKAVYAKLPNGTWTVASMHNYPHLSGSNNNNGFDGHLCVHFLRDMDECMKNDPNYGVNNQNLIRQKWKQITGITVE